MTFLHPVTKQPASTLEVLFSYSTLQKKFCWSKTKMGTAPLSAIIFWAMTGLWPAVTHTLSTL